MTRGGEVQIEPLGAGANHCEIAQYTNQCACNSLSDHSVAACSERKEEKRGKCHGEKVQYGFTILLLLLVRPASNIVPCVM